MALDWGARACVNSHANSPRMATQLQLIEQELCWRNPTPSSHHHIVPVATVPTSRLASFSPIRSMDGGLKFHPIFSLFFLRYTHRNFFFLLWNDKQKHNLPPAPPPTHTHTLAYKMIIIIKQHVLCEYSALEQWDNSCSDNYCLLTEAFIWRWWWWGRCQHAPGARAFSTEHRH